jgi:hypothetical protein
MAQLTFRIFVPGHIASKEHGTYFWRSLLHHSPDHVPSGYGHGANPTSRFDPNDLDVVLKKWNRRNLYFEGEPRLSFSGQILRPWPSTDHTTHTDIFIYAFEDDPAAVKAFVYEISNGFLADYATAHILTKERSRRILQQRADRAWLKSPALGKKCEENLQRHLGLWPKRRVLGPEIGAINPRRGYIHDLYWLTVFGPRYVEFFGRDRILAMPAHEVRELPHGSIGVELTDGLPDDAVSLEKFLVARDRAKDYLNHNAFFDSKLPRTHAYSGPIFQPADFRTPRSKK